MGKFDGAPLITGAGELWQAATRARFLDAVADGSLPAAAFARWLVQDYQFAAGLVTYQSLMIAKAPRAAHSLLIAGLSALETELSWFESHAARLQLNLATPAHPIGRRYVNFLVAAAYTEPFAVLAAILFGVEAAYLAAWSALPATGPYAEFIARWSGAAFRDYVRGLGALAGQHPHGGQQAAFNEVLRHERDFWQMSWEG